MSTSNKPQTPVSKTGSLLSQCAIGAALLIVGLIACAAMSQATPGFMPASALIALFVLFGLTVVAGFWLVLRGLTHNPYTTEAPEPIPAYARRRRGFQSGGFDEQ